MKKPLLIVVASTTLAIAGCSGKSTVVGHSSGGGTVGSREVKFDLDGPGGFSAGTGPIVGTITFDGGKVNVEKSRLLLDDKEIAKLPDDTKIVLVEYKAGKVTITADGANVYSSALGK